MKKIFFIAILLLNIPIYAQPPGGGRGKPHQNENNQVKERKEFKASEVAGIFYYDDEEVLKKLKVKDEDKQNLVKKALKNYNFKMKEISFLNSKKLSDLDAIVNASSRMKDSEGGDGIREIVEKVVRPIRENIQEFDKELNKTLETTLSKKELKKWLKYQKKKKESLQPKKPNTENRQGSRSNGGGMRRQ